MALREMPLRTMPLGMAQRGMALLAILGLILLIFTSSLIAGLSLNERTQQRQQVSSASLSAVRDALMGYTLLANSNAQPPGSLPCPAQNRAGVSAINPATNACLTLRGLVPYRTLGIEEPLDGSGAPLWYAPAAALTGNSNPPVLLRNSSTASTLRLNLSAANRNEDVAFVLLAPNPALGAQQPNTAPLAAANQFLEGSNAAANTTQYDDLRDAQHNDQVLAMPLGTFWSQVEKRVLAEVQQTLQAYRTQCGVYPWAAVWAVAGNNSQANRYDGAVPLGTALPFNWGASCGANTAPPAPATWLRSHWGRLYYALCDQPAVNPPSASCLQVTTQAGNTAAKVIIAAPGIVLSAVVPAQNRSQTGLSHYFELLNADANTHTYNQLPVNQHTPVFNDVVFIVE